MDLNEGEFVMLQGKRHPLWKGVLRLAGESGLRKLSVRLIQAPGADNGGMAICEATAVFRSPDGQEREFSEVGDCDGSNCGKMIAPHRVRMAATRAKGRALRDALGIGEALLEELSGPEETAEGAGSPSPSFREQGKPSRANERVRPAESRGDRAANPPAAASATPGEVAPVEHWCDGCGVKIEGIETKKGPVSIASIVQLSTQRWGRKLCHACGKTRMQAEQVNVPAGQIA